MPLSRFFIRRAIHTVSIQLLLNTSNECGYRERCLTRLRLGHKRLTNWRIISREQPPLCEHCGEDLPLIIRDKLTKCPTFNNMRRRRTDDEQFWNNQYTSSNNINCFVSMGFSQWIFFSYGKEDLFLRKLQVKKIYFPSLKKRKKKSTNSFLC